MTFHPQKMVHTFISRRGHGGAARRPGNRHIRDTPHLLNRGALSETRPRSFGAPQPVSTQYGERGLKNLTKNNPEHKKMARRFVSDMCRRAWPGPSDNLIAEKMAAATGYSHKQCMNILQDRFDAGASLIFAALVTAGVEVTCSRLEPKASSDRAA